MTHRVIAVIFGLWLLLAPGSVRAQTPDWSAVGLSIGNEAALTDGNRADLWALITSVPRAEWPWLQQITINGIGTNPDVPYRINCFSGDGRTENPFPADAPASLVTTGFYAVCSHELTHHIDYTIQQTRPWLAALRTAFVAEAGCVQSHYLRSMLPECYFVTYPQEFVASIGNQWLADSEGVWRLAYARWQHGNPHPANQAALMTAIFGLCTWDGCPSGWATVAAFRWTPEGVRMIPWQVSGWTCDGENIITGPSFRVRVTLAGCRVTALEVK